MKDKHAPSKSISEIVSDKLVAIRHTAVEALRDPFRDTLFLKHSRHDVVTIAVGVRLDPSRKVADQWKPSPYDKISTVIVRPTGPYGEMQVDAGDGPGVIVNTGGPYRVRILSGQQIGQVLEMNALDYRMLRARCQSSSSPIAEPVPDSVSPRSGIFPPNFPSNYNKACRMAEAALGKSSGALTFLEVVDYFRKLKPKLEFAA